MVAKRRSRLRRDRPGQIVDRAARRAEQQDFRTWAEGTQKRSGFLQADRCRVRPNGPDAYVTGLGTLCVRFGHPESATLSESC